MSSWALNMETQEFKAVSLDVRLVLVDVRAAIAVATLLPQLTLATAEAKSTERIWADRQRAQKSKASLTKQFKMPSRERLTNPN